MITRKKRRSEPSGKNSQDAMTDPVEPFQITEQSIGRGKSYSLSARTIKTVRSSSSR